MKKYIFCSLGLMVLMLLENSVYASCTPDTESCPDGQYCGCPSGVSYAHCSGGFQCIGSTDTSDDTIRDIINH